MTEEEKEFFIMAFQKCWEIAEKTEDKKIAFMSSCAGNIIESMFFDGDEGELVHDAIDSAIVSCKGF